VEKWKAFFAFRFSMPRIRFDRKRLGNTPFRRKSCVVKWLDE